MAIKGFPCKASFQVECNRAYDKLRIAFGPGREPVRLNPEDDAKMMAELEKEYEEGNHAGTD